MGKDKKELDFTQSDIAKPAINVGTVGHIDYGNPLYNGGDPYNPHAMSHHETKITIEKLLGWEEGFQSKPYFCSEGYITYGIGHRLSSIKDDDLSKYSDLWISYEDAEILLAKDLRKLRVNIIQSSFVSSYDKLSKSRQIIIESMVYQMGIAGVAGFTNMWACIANEDFAGAAAEMIDSKWHTQTPKRARRHAEVMSIDDLKFAYGSFMS